MVEGDVSHDRITRFLSEQDYTSRDLWQEVKSTVRMVERDEGVLIFDDTIQEKAWTDESELMCWHFDHCSGRNVRGINLLNALYHCNGTSIPVAFELACSDLTCDYDAITIIYKKWWKVEVFHKSLKSNANLAKSPTRTVRTQSNHIFMSICAAFKLEGLSIKNKLNPFALCRKLLINASRTAYAELQQFRAAA